MKICRIFIIAFFALLFAGGLFADVPLAGWVHNSGFGDRLKRDWPHLLWTIRIFGKFPFFTIPAAAIMAYVGRPRWQPAIFVLLSGVFVAANDIVKWIVGRHRPFVRADVFHLHPFFHGIRGLGGPNLSFPSGDVCLTAATAASLGILLPRWRIISVAVVALVMVERIAEGAHYPSDTVGGAALGWILALIAWKILGKPVLEISSPAPDNHNERSVVLPASPPLDASREET